MLLVDFLRNKPLYYTEIDYTRMPRIYEKIKENFTINTLVHIIGTNGKGTTGRFLATALYNLGYKTAHYTSPHILEFNERIWIDGKDVSNELLESKHQELQSLLSKEDVDALSYFEYTTFLAMLVFNNCEYIILEAGLGGVHDATAVFAKNLTLVTPIDYDHESFLGSNIESIAKEKLYAIQNNAIIAKQRYKKIETVIEAVKKDKNVNVFTLDTLIKEEDRKHIKLISKDLSLSPYLEDNLCLSISALKFLDIKYTAKSFEDSKLFGRLTRFKENILLDVGHNPLAASSIVKSLVGEKYTLVYNTYKDKDYKKILEILKPITKDLKIIDIKDERIAPVNELQKILTDLEIKYDSFKSIEKNEKYLVFGSFSVVETFLRAMSE